MSLIPRHNLHAIEQLIDQAFTPLRQDLQRANTLTPRVDLRETEDQFEITLELPGIKKEQVAITLHQGTLSVEAENNQETADKNTKVLRQERQYGKFKRSFELGPQVQENAITAHFDNGILTLLAPKIKEQPPAWRRIDVA
jgi:HSP20 family protein